MSQVTSRVHGLFKPSDYPGVPDESTKRDIDALFKHMFPQAENPEIPGSAAAFAIAARNPKLGLLLVKLSDYFVGEMPWSSRRKDMKQLAIQTLNYHFKCDLSFQSHIKSAQRDGVSLELQALIPLWRTANVFDEEQKLVIEYTLAVVNGEVSDELFSRVLKKYGEQETIEFTAAVAWWSFWAMLINATGTKYDFGYGRPAA